MPPSTTDSADYAQIFRDYAGPSGPRDPALFLRALYRDLAARDQVMFRHRSARAANSMAYLTTADMPRPFSAANRFFGLVLKHVRDRICNGKPMGKLGQTSAIGTVGAIATSLSRETGLPFVESTLIVAAVLHYVFGPIHGAFCEMTDEQAVKGMTQKPTTASKPKLPAKKKTAKKKASTKKKKKR